MLKFFKGDSKIKEDIRKEFDKLNLHTCCFTGHRSQKLPWKFNEDDLRYKMTRNRVEDEIEKAITKGYNHFISGMAIGFDIMCAEIVLEFKKKYKNIILECEVPCKGQESKWIEKEQIRYRRILKQADKIRCIYDKYVDGCMKERNPYMINNSSLVIALFNGQWGGTKQTIEYAKSQGVEVIIINPVDKI